METIRLGKSGLIVGRLAFGALPIQRRSLEDAVALLKRAVEGGITFFDTARAYTDSEEKIGMAFAGMREKLVIATKSLGKNRAAIEADFASSLDFLRTDYLDLYQLHNPKGALPRPGDGTERYETLAEMKEAGVIRSIGITAHSLQIAMDAVQSGLYDTVQYPFSLLATPEEEALVKACKDADVGFIAMKGLAGGLIKNIPAAFAYTRRFDNVLPIWGIEKDEELEEFLRFDAAPPAWGPPMQAAAEQEKSALGGKFCRSCGYCLPCPQEIDIPQAARMMALLGRAVWQTYATPAWIRRMALAKTCIQCGECAERCPYDLDTPALVAENVAGYEVFMKEKGVLQELLPEKDS